MEGRKDDDGKDLDPSKLLDLRILVHRSQVGSVIGKSGDKVKELRERHRMQIIKIYQEFAPLSTDRVLQLIGEPENVFTCVEDIMETLEVSYFPVARNNSLYICKFEISNFRMSYILRFNSFCQNFILNCAQVRNFQKFLGVKSYEIGNFDCP